MTSIYPLDIKKSITELIENREVYYHLEKSREQYTLKKEVKKITRR
ncbi:hypothetical protein ACFLZZ_04420 [Nanoarchaeota archaeon]